MNTGGWIWLLMAHPCLLGRVALVGPSVVLPPSAKETEMGHYRDRMIEEMSLRGYASGTQEQYVYVARAFVKHFMKPVCASM